MEIIEKIAIWFLISMIYAFAGWLFEVTLGIIQRRKLVNRGFLVGPICPIYGIGAVIISFLLRDTENAIAIFCVGVVGGGLLEYISSYIMEKLFRVRWWDYSLRFCNLNGRICLTSVVFFGCLGLLVVKVTTPLLYNLLAAAYSPIVLAFAAGAFACLVADIALSLWLINDVRVTVGTVQRDATEEISERVREVLMEKGKLNRRLVKAFPDQAPSQKKPKPRKTRHSK